MWPSLPPFNGHWACILHLHSNASCHYPQGKLADQATSSCSEFLQHTIDCSKQTNRVCVCPFTSPSRLAPSSPRAQRINISHCMCNPFAAAPWEALLQTLMELGLHSEAACSQKFPFLNSHIWFPFSNFHWWHLHWHKIIQIKFLILTLCLSDSSCLEE